MNWIELTFEQQCVMVNAIGEGDLHSLLYEWEPNWSPEDFDQIVRALGSAVLELVDAGLVNAFTSGTSQPTSIGAQDVRAVIANPKAWWNGDEGLEVVVWTALTDAGNAVLATAPSRDAMYAYERR